MTVNKKYKFLTKKFHIKAFTWQWTTKLLNIHTAENVQQNKEICIILPHLQVTAHIERT